MATNAKARKTKGKAPAAKAPAPKAADGFDPIAKNRLHNTRLLKLFYNGPVNLSRKLGYKNGSFITQISGPNPDRPITTKQARKMESLLDLPFEILDSDPAQGRLKSALGIEGDNVLNMGAYTLDKAMNRNRGARMKLSDVIARVMRALGTDANPENVGKATMQVLDVADIADQEPNTVMVEKIAERHRNTGS